MSERNGVLERSRKFVKNECVLIDLKGDILAEMKVVEDRGEWIVVRDTWSDPHAVMIRLYEIHHSQVLAVIRYVENPNCPHEKKPIIK